jgi:hypothetical protein
MKLVVTYSTGDGYTFEFDKHIPIEYKSIEDFLFDFEMILEKQTKATEYPRNGKFYLAKMYFPFEPFIYLINEEKEIYSCSLPNVLTLEQWWEEQYKYNKEIESD